MNPGFIKADLTIIKTPLPDKAKGGLFIDQAGEYMVLINSKLPEEEQEAAFVHEMKHLWHDDFNSKLSAGEIEKRRHEKTQ